jgi:hypothetical protein
LKRRYRFNRATKFRGGPAVLQQRQQNVNVANIKSRAAIAFELSLVEPPQSVGDDTATRVALCRKPQPIQTASRTQLPNGISNIDLQSLESANRFCVKHLVDLTRNEFDYNHR